MEEQLQPEVPQTFDTLTQLPPQDSSVYIPSSMEKKKAVMMYFFFGTMIVLSEKKANAFELFHFKQAIGWWVSFMMVAVIGVVLLFIPILKIIGTLGVIGMIILFVIMAKQAWNGKFHADIKGYGLAIFPSLGNRLLNLFDVHIGDDVGGAKL